MAELVMAGAVVAALVGLRMLVPGNGREPRWRRRLTGRWDAWHASVRDRARRVAGIAGTAESTPDPFVVLQLQWRLGVLAEQIRALEDDPVVYAKAHRLVAARGAYDDLLAQACRLAGVAPTTGGGPQPGRVHRPRLDDASRYREELELASRGWSW